MENLYRVTFETKKNGYKRWVVDISAENLKATRQKLDEMWKSDMHKFNIKIRRLKDDEEFLFHWFLEKYLADIIAAKTGKEVKIW